MPKRMLCFVFVFASGLTSLNAQELAFEWSFVTGESSNGPPSGAGHLIRGTIAGLTEGDNDGSGLTVLVTETPTGKVLGGGWTFSGTLYDTAGPAFVVTDGEVTLGNAVFLNNAGQLHMGTDPSNETTPFPLLSDGVFSAEHVWWNGDGGVTSFVAIPEPSGPVLSAIGIASLVGCFRFSKRNTRSHV